MTEVTQHIACILHNDCHHEGFTRPAAVLSDGYVLTNSSQITCPPKGWVCVCVKPLQVSDSL